MAKRKTATRSRSQISQVHTVGYSTDDSTFEDQTVYRCERCEWSSPYEEKMKAHVDAHLPVPVGDSPRSSGTTDASGRAE